MKRRPPFLIIFYWQTVLVSALVVPARVVLGSAGVHAADSAAAASAWEKDSTGWIDILLK